MPVSPLDDVDTSFVFSPGTRILDSLAISQRHHFDARHSIVARPSSYTLGGAWGWPDCQRRRIWISFGDGEIETAQRAGIAMPGYQRPGQTRDGCQPDD